MITAADERALDLYDGDLIAKADERFSEVATCDECGHEVADDDLRFARDLELCVDCFIERGEK